MNDTEEYVDDDIDITDEGSDEDEDDNGDSDEENSNDIDHHDPDVDSDANNENAPRFRASLKGVCVRCGVAVRPGHLVTWFMGREVRGMRHVDCQSVNQEPPSRDGTPVSLAETTPKMPAGDNEAMSLALSALPEIREIEGPTVPWQSSVQFVEEAKQDIEWLIPGLLPAGAVVLLSGREGSMKTYLAISIAHAVATGLPWIGTPTRQGAVMYLDGEMQRAALQDRLRGIGPTKDLNIWSWTDNTFPRVLTGDLLREASSCHSLIIVDTLRRFMADLKENNADDMAQITDALRELTRRGATVLVLHHAIKDPERLGGYRGSSELGAGVDILISLVKKTTRNTTHLTLDIEKSRYSFSDKYEIEVTKGERAPVFSMNNPTQDNGKRAFEALRTVIVALRQDSGTDPLQNEVILEAGRRGLGGKDKVRDLLKAGEGKYWRSIRTGRGLTYTAIAA